MPVALKGSTSGEVTLTAPAVAGANTITLPAATGTVLVPTTVGTSGQVLTSSGSEVPTWANNAALFPIDIGAVTGASSFSLTSIPTTYSTYWISISASSNTASGNFSIALSSNNGSSYGSNIIIASHTSSNRSQVGWVKITNVNTVGASKLVTGYVVANDGVMTTVNSTEAVVTGAINALRFTSSTSGGVITTTLFGVA